MHELYIAESIIRTLRESLPADVTPDRVREAHVECGQLDAVIPETLQFLFDAIKAQHRLDDARLVIREIPVRCRCEACRAEFGLDLPVFICPECGGQNVQTLAGRGIRLVKINATDTEGEE